MNLLNMLTWWQWLILAAVPPLIVTLYFLKLRRLPLQVPSTYLWSRTIEDLHVNSIWQRLRQNLLLFLQLLLVLLVMLACLRPGWQGSKLTGNRFIFMIDASASMSATDVSPTRLDAAKERVLALIDQMRSSDQAMVITFSNVAKVEEPFTSNRGVLRDRVGSITPTNRTSDISEALRAASGLANPGQNDPDNPNLADAQPATLYIFSDGGVDEVPNFKLGNLKPEYMKIGTEKPKNVAITAFSVGRNPDKPTEQQAFARLENFGPEAVAINLELTVHREGALIHADKDAKKLPAAEYKTDADGKIISCIPSSGGVQFNLADLEEGILRLEIKEADVLAVDNAAHAALVTPRRARVLVVSPGNDALKLALNTEEILKIAEISLAEPALLETKAFEEQAAAGQYDLIIFDQCSPKIMPQCNTFFLRALPPRSKPAPAVVEAVPDGEADADATAESPVVDDEWKAGPPQGPPSIIDTDRGHPLMSLVEMGNVTIAEAIPVDPPAGGSVLMDADIGPLLAIAPRDGYEDAVLGFAIIATEKDGSKKFHTDWYKRLSFPLFLKNVLEYLGGNAGAPSLPTVQPGTPMILRSQSPVQKMTVETPSQQRTDIGREGQGSFVYTSTNEQGVYNVVEGTAKNVSQRFAVNLFSSRESDLQPAEKITLGYEAVPGTAGVERARQEIWKWLLIIGVLVLIFEWYVYNKRVYF